MSSINCHTVMKKFHANEVNLSTKQRDDMRSRRNAGRTRLKNGLETNNYPSYINIKTQGSYQMITMVQDSDNEYDIDDGVYFKSEDLINDGVELTPKQVRERVCKALEWDGRLKQLAKVKDNCVRQEYPEGYHIDYPIYREIDGKYQLASGDKWSDSDAQEVTRWFKDNVRNDLQRDQEDTSQLRRLVKLTKKYSRRNNWKHKTTSGIAITKLVVDHYVASDNRDDLALRQTWEQIKSSLSISTIIRHPVADTNITDDGDKEVEFFNECLSNSLNDLLQLDCETITEKKALQIWDKVFDTNFFESQHKDDKSTPTLSIVSDDSVIRTGNKRFG